MRILFTGAASFTGYWFVKELAAAGHDITAVFQSNVDNYTGVRFDRVQQLLGLCTPLFNCSFGSDRFIDAIKSGSSWDLLCHHAADVSNYKSPDFDIAKAVGHNTFNLSAVLDELSRSGCRKIVITGSVFEQNEGAGSDLWKAFSPYGLSKGITAEIVRFHTSQKGMKLGKFVISNPFGPYEELRFTNYLMQQWAEGRTAAVATPLYIRDNIHVSLLAKAYRYFVENLSDQCPRYERMNPSGYVESQGDFTRRFAREMGARLGLPCEIDFRSQQEFPEPKMRVNTEAAAAMPLQWDEVAAWDELAAYYQLIFNLQAGKTR